MISSFKNEYAAARADDTGEDPILVFRLQLLVGEIGGYDGSQSLVLSRVKEIV